jgi:hypothetical protein
MGRGEKERQRQRRSDEISPGPDGVDPVYGSGLVGRGCAATFVPSVGWETDGPDRDDRKSMVLDV